MSEDVAARVWRGMRGLVLERHERRKEVCDALGMSFIRVKALRLLAPGPLTLRRLAERLTTDAPYTTIVVADLERRGLVERAPHPEDRRAKIVSITPEGVTAAELAERILGEPPSALLALDPADLDALDRVIARLLAAGS
ncbi:MarR family transcriptional regulator [Microtetraspora sp. AC03309]|uniref:MarR family winged helix-turn-helix transcriptional regulator n=1 Tax=Microtetraspora sp. AC03309 TaxID=2779376 RepID=UPI001E5753E0|nr:MarR family transcriptional regulator [Microtetraspora sp. AC03309]MCC5579742.1 MarR family transcriptional regulator [Microtetraspora sp. AC03309]